jgi:hypothetical protein
MGVLSLGGTLKNISAIADISWQKSTVELKDITPITGLDSSARRTHLYGLNYAATTHP